MLRIHPRRFFFKNHAFIIDAENTKPNLPFAELPLTRVHLPAHAMTSAQGIGSHTRRIFANGNESCPSGALLREGGPRAEKPARANPARIAQAIRRAARDSTLARAHLLRFSMIEPKG